MPIGKLNEGHFLLSEEKKVEVINNVEKKSGDYISQYVKYKHLSEKINGYLQNIHLLEINKNNKIQILPVLAQDSIFGFEYLSDIHKRNGAYATINSGFFYEYGQPSGMVVIKGKLISKGIDKFPVLVIKEDGAELKEFNTKLFLTDDDNRIIVDKFNSMEAKAGEINVYTKEYGRTNRLKVDNISYVVEGNIVKKIVDSNSETEVPGDGILISYIKPQINSTYSEIREGDKIYLEYESNMDADLNAYECGSWILKNGKIVVPKKDDWIGVMSNHDPRTAVGIKKDGTIVFITVDGRQPDFSTGLTGKELAEFLLEYGIKDAAMLDGGASAEMIIDGQIVNSPSAGRERLVGGGIVVKAIEN